MQSFEAQPLTVFRPATSVGTLWGAGVTALSALLGLALIYKGLSMDVRFAQLFPFLGGAFFLVLAGIYAYWTWGCISLAYVVDRNAFTIRWGGIRQVVPIGNIRRLIPGNEGETPHIEGINWPGHHVGLANAEELGDIFFYSNHRTPDEVLYVQTVGGTYAISVPDPIAFARTLQANNALGAIYEQRQAVQRWGLAAQTFWSDRWALVLSLVMLVAFFAVLGYVLDLYPGLAENIQLRFPASGGIIRSADKSDLLDIPRSAAALVAVNLVLAVLLHTWERMIAYLLLLAGIAVQVMLVVGAAVAVA
jgi:hypothetical protein